jgi:L-Ala-D/L-Glu epimerase
MSRQESVTWVLEETITGALADSRFQSILDGRTRKSNLRTFFRHFIVTHLNSVQILSFLYSVAPPEATDLVKENLLEEMGLEESVRSHPDLLLDLARGLGFTHQEITQMVVESQEARRRFVSQAVLYPTLRELGLSVLLETLAFEAFLSRVSDCLAESLMTHYGLSATSIYWFTLHGEVDVRHAEEGKRVVERYLSFYRFTEEGVKSVLRKTFDRNVILERYFPKEIPTRRSVQPSGIQSVDVLSLCIPFNQSFRHAQMDRLASDAVVVRVRGKDGSSGYGEALPRTYVPGEDVPGMVVSLSSSLAPMVLKRNLGAGLAVLDDIREILVAWARKQPTGPDIVAWNATQCSMELALLDWGFKRAGRSIAEWLTPVRQHITYTGVIEAADPEVAAEMAQRYLAAKFTAFKVKVGVEDDVRRVETVRQIVGPHADIRVDANAAWTAAEAIPILQALRRSGIVAVEQPVGAADLAGMRQVREETGLSVIADEALVTLDDARKLVKEQVCDVFNVRVSKCGGLLAAQTMAEIGLSAGLRVQVGAQLGETSLLSAAGRHLALHLPAVEYVEGSFGTHLLSEDITPDPVMFGYEGRGELLLHPGLGVAVDDQALERIAVDLVEIRI